MWLRKLEKIVREEIDQADEFSIIFSLVIYYLAILF